MTDKVYNELEVERGIEHNFGVETKIAQVVAFEVPVSRTALATVFLTDKKQLYVYIGGQSKLSLGDVQKIISRMGLRAEVYMPPKGRPKYFDEVGEANFKQIFPGRTNINQDDIRFYRTLAPYSPALVLIKETIGGHIYQFDSDSNEQWRQSVKFTYRRMLTS